MVLGGLEVLVTGCHQLCMVLVVVMVYARLTEDVSMIFIWSFVQLLSLTILLMTFLLLYVASLF